MEVTVSNDFGVALIGFVGVNVGLVAVKRFAVDSEVGGIKDMDGTVFQTGLDFFNLSTVPGAAAVSLTSVSTTEAVASVPVQSLSTSLPSIAALMAYSRYGVQSMREETMKVFGQALWVLPL